MCEFPSAIPSSLCNLLYQLWHFLRPSSRASSSFFILCLFDKIYCVIFTPSFVSLSLSWSHILSILYLFQSCAFFTFFHSNSFSLLILSFPSLRFFISVPHQSTISNILMTFCVSLFLRLSFIFFFICSFPLSHPHPQPIFTPSSPPLPCVSPCLPRLLCMPSYAMPHAFLSGSAHLST